MKNLAEMIQEALEEDIGRGDITTKALIPAGQVSEAFIFTKTSGVIFGLAIAAAVFKKLDRRARCRFLCEEGQRVPAGKKILTIKAKTRAILTGERVALNFLSHLSGIATLTAEFVKKARLFRAKILDTRKTTPGLRVLEKSAVKAGGGTNHRKGLYDMILIKDNHRTARQKQLLLGQMVSRVKARSDKPVEIEVDNLKELKEVLGSRPNVILLDNMPITAIKKAVAIVKSLHSGRRPLLEVSGNVNLKNVRAIARTGVDRISIGALTHSRKPLDLSLELVRK